MQKEEVDLEKRNKLELVDKELFWFVFNKRDN